MAVCAVTMTFLQVPVLMQASPHAVDFLMILLVIRMDVSAISYVILLETAVLIY